MTYGRAFLHVLLYVRLSSSLQKARYYTLFQFKYGERCERTRLKQTEHAGRFSSWIREVMTCMDTRIWIARQSGETREEEESKTDVVTMSFPLRSPTHLPQEFYTYVFPLSLSFLYIFLYWKQNVSERTTLSRRTFVAEVRRERGESDSMAEKRSNKC